MTPLLAVVEPGSREAHPDLSTQLSEQLGRAHHALGQPSPLRLDGMKRDMQAVRYEYQPRVMRP
jgi:hypothetical protein